MRFFFIGYFLGFFYCVFIYGKDENIYYVFFIVIGFVVYYFNFGKLFLYDVF